MAGGGMDSRKCLQVSVWVQSLSHNHSLCFNGGKDLVMCYYYSVFFYEKRLPSERHETLAFHDVSETFLDYFTRKRVNNSKILPVMTHPGNSLGCSCNKILGKLRPRYVISAAVRSFGEGGGLGMQRRGEEGPRGKQAWSGRIYNLQKTNDDKYSCFIRL